MRSHIPEWAEKDSNQWQRADLGWAIVLLNGAPIWQEPIWHLEWGAGISGYASYFRERFGKRDEAGVPHLEGWDTTTWSIGLANLLNHFSDTTSDFFRFEPTSRSEPEPSRLHPVDEQRRRNGY